MMEDDEQESITVRILAPDGRFISGYGSREQGQTIELPAAVARSLLEQYPGDFEEVVNG